MRGVIAEYCTKAILSQLISFISNSAFQLKMTTNFRFLLSLILFLSAIFLYSQNSSDFEYRIVENKAWDVGEKLKFRVYYESLLTGQVNAGTAEVEVRKTNRKFNDRATFHIVGTGKSNRTFDFFFKVRDRFESYVDIESLSPHHFIRRTKEGGYVRDDDVYFDHKNAVATSRRKTKPIVPYVQDILSAAYFARTLNADTLEVGDNISINFFLDDSLYNSYIQFQGRELVETDLGVFRCLAFKPMVATGEVFSNPYPMTLWITDDENRIPVLAKSAVIVGSVKIELIDLSGLKNPITSRVRNK